jgi:hypothetical protein
MVLDKSSKPKFKGHLGVFAKTLAEDEPANTDAREVEGLPSGWTRKVKDGRVVSPIPVLGDVMAVYVSASSLAFQDSHGPSMSSWAPASVSNNVSEISTGQGLITLAPLPLRFGKDLHGIGAAPRNGCKRPQRNFLRTERDRVHLAPLLARFM